MSIILLKMYFFADNRECSNILIDRIIIVINYDIERCNNEDSFNRLRKNG